MELKPHDIVKLNGAPFSLISEEPLPAWAEASLAAAPYAVVRRFRRAGDAWPIGVRGERRDQRFAAFAPESAIAGRVAPEQLAADLRIAPGRAPLPAFRALLLLGPLLDGIGASWGPAGSVGFELATGVRAVSALSDLDLVVRYASPPPLRESALLLQWRRRAPARVDIQLELPQGAVALEEYASGTGRLLLRGPNGPQLVGHPLARRERTRA